MTIGAIIQCRLDSSRLQGKVLLPAAGKPLLWYLLARCRTISELGGGASVVVATSQRPVDEPIVDYCRQNGIRVYRGPAEDAAKRLIEAAQEAGFSHFFRMNGDSPFIEHPLVAEAASRAAGSAYDFVTNLHPRSFPYGVSVELVRTAALAGAYPRFASAEHREHATLFFLERMAQVPHYNISNGADLSGVRMAIDTLEDFRSFERVVAAVGARWPALSFREALPFYAGAGARR